MGEKKEDKEVLEQAAAGGKVIIRGSLDITLADGTVDKRPFQAEVPLVDTKEEKKDG